MRSTDVLLRLLDVAEASAVTVGRSSALIVRLDTDRGGAPRAKHPERAVYYARSGSIRITMTQEEADALIAAGAKSE
jgi:hypothetical protein